MIPSFVFNQIRNLKMRFRILGTILEIGLRNRSDTAGKIWSFSTLLHSAFFCIAFATKCESKQPEIWISPTEDVTQHGQDFHDFFLHPEEWRIAAHNIKRFSIAVNYLLNTPSDIVAHEMKVLHDLGIKLDVAVPALPVDKNLCGNNIEGTVWPGEPRSYSLKLRDLGIDVYSFSLDLPLTAGYRDKSSNSCHFSILETAKHTARATADILTVYPNAKIVDIEVPTGTPPSIWSIELQEWIDDYKLASGRDFDGFMMDAWWLFDWRSAAQETVRILHSRQIPVGIGIDASGFNNSQPAQWIKEAKSNFCSLRATRLPLQFLGVSNFQNMRVPGLPENNPASLTGMVVWLSGSNVCQ